jgi:hypothetical protein
MLLHFNLNLDRLEKFNRQASLRQIRHEIIVLCISCFKTATILFWFPDHSHI